MTGYTKSKADDIRDQKSAGLIVIIAVILAPFAPLLAATYYAYLYLHDQAGWHPLFAGATAALPTVLGLVLLWNSKVFRLVYFGTYTVVGSYFLYLYVLDWQKDHIWAYFAAGVGAFVGLIFTIALWNPAFLQSDDEEQPEAAAE
jgi:FtsH-binding integral membrane protein